MNDQEQDSSGASREMPRYKCHKEVWALKIGRIEPAPAGQERAHAGGDWLLHPADAGYGPVLVGHDEYVLKHKPEPGGYYVVYDDGYKSYSPAGPFEAGYALKAGNAKREHGSHASAVLYPAIKAAMDELDQLPPTFNFTVNRAFNLLHAAFWSECPAPASAPQLRAAPLDLNSEAPLARCEPAGTGDTCESCQ